MHGTGFTEISLLWNICDKHSCKKLKTFIVPKRIEIVFWQHSTMKNSKLQPPQKPSSRRIQVRQSGVHGKGVLHAKTSQKVKPSSNTLAKSFQPKKLKTDTRTIPKILTILFIFKLTKIGWSMLCMVAIQLAGSTIAALPTASRKLTMGVSLSRPKKTYWQEKN